MNFSELRELAAKVVSMDQCSSEYDAATKQLWHGLSGSQKEALRQIVKSGPVWDGDVISKGARDDLMRIGLASRACVKGEQGYTVANYRGWDVLKAGGSA